MNSIIDLGSISQPITELIKAISSGIGTLYRPRQIRNETKAKAEEIKILSRARTEAEIERRELLNQTDILKVIDETKDGAEVERKVVLAEAKERIANRLVGQELRRQQNLDDIFDKTAHELSTVKEVPKDKVNKDWATRFVNITQDVSEEEMKVLWAHLLAGEIKSPGSYSLRTLETLRNLSSEEAQLFAKVSKYAFKGGRDMFIYHDDSILREIGLSEDDIMSLMDAGLIKSIYNTVYEISTNEIGKDVILFTYQNYAIQASISNISVPAHVYTTTGSQIYRLMEYQNGDIAYLQKALHTIGNGSIKFSVFAIKSWQDNTNFKVDENSKIEIS
jgi:hypothetical protein